MTGALLGNTAAHTGMGNHSLEKLFFFKPKDSSQRGQWLVDLGHCMTKKELFQALVVKLYSIKNVKTVTPIMRTYDAALI